MNTSFVLRACCLAWALQGGLAFSQGVPPNACSAVNIDTLSDLNFGTVYFSRGREGRVVMYPNERLEAAFEGVALPLSPTHSPGRVRISGPANTLIYLSLSNPATRSVKVDEIKLVNPLQQRELEKRGNFWVLQTKNFSSLELSVTGTLNFDGLTNRQTFFTTFSVDCELVEPD